MVTVGKLQQQLLETSNRMVAARIALQRWQISTDEAVVQAYAVLLVV
jgi:hypothetical protein